MQLCKENLPLLHNTRHLKPSPVSFELPEKVLQFGTGVLLRGLPDYYIHKANQQGLFNGRIVVVKSTGKGTSDEFDVQDGMYTHCIRGYKHNELFDDFYINNSISRVLSANTHWHQVLACAENPDLQLVISNTTEVGIVLHANEDVNNGTPVSFPGKLLAFLYRRFTFFNGAADKGMVIVPTELVTGNGDLLKSIVLELAVQNNLGNKFTYWLQHANTFCNSLVDRIVPGKLAPKELEEVQAMLGYTDELMIMSEVYSLWAIEVNDSRAVSVLSFAPADEGVVLTNNIDKYRELKLRLLNGTHTLCCAAAFMAGFNTVKEAMADERFLAFLQALMLDELAPCIVSEDIKKQEAIAFGESVLARFKNPFLEHRWLSISLNYTHKMYLRNVPMIAKYYHHKNSVPVRMAFGFAAYLLFMNCRPAGDGLFEGIINEVKYTVQDENAEYFYHAWQQKTNSDVANAVLSNHHLWGQNLTLLPGFSAAVAVYMKRIAEKGVLAALPV